ncbi:hypothetical protein DOTSEDRAFT_69674 [Dothistroma septosporum NZE10]|uniref:SigF-like NTF2-like domain-containing protein n=1 Tax=Dothistroma septosporum (strain NZE10 / CBS 128990) TaxID=675120 RepID=N1PXU4_DOTSN|nr:hypothetical protein DOTSEDRAFT_69674 [Dothistroma septosporum NZE10]
MDDPIQDVADVVHRLTQGSPKQQEEAINEYFTTDASFTHPFCRTGSFEGSRWLIHAIFRWYKVMSPKIDLTVHSVAFDETNLILYINISQVFSIWLVPFHHAHVNLTTVLQLVRKQRKYYIQSQNDLYQADQFIKFPPGLSHMGPLFILFWNFLATFFCVVGAYIGAPFTRYMQRQSEKRNDMGGYANGDAFYRRQQEMIRSKQYRP